MHKINKRGQSTVEYILLVAAVIAVMVAFTTNSGTGVQKQLNITLDTAANQMSDVAGRLSDSEAGTNASSTYVSNYTVNPQQVE